MAELVDALPPTPPPKPKPQPKAAEEAAPVVLSAAVLDRYVGEYTHVAVGTTVTVRRDGDKLLLKSGKMPEGPSSRGRRRASGSPGRSRPSSSSSTARER